MTDIDRISKHPGIIEFTVKRAVLQTYHECVHELWEDFHETTVIEAEKAKENDEKLHMKSHIEEASFLAGTQVAFAQRQADLLKIETDEYPECHYLTTPV